MQEPRIDALGEASAGAVSAAAASKIMYIGGSGGLLGFLLSSQFLGLVGVLIALGGFVTNLYFKWHENKRAYARHLMEEEEHKRRMRQMETKPRELDFPEN